MTQASHFKTNLRYSPAFWGFIVLIVGLVTRLLVIFLYQPVSYSDTPSYRRLAGTVLQGFANYDGTRTPGYPVFLALVGNDQRVWLTQLALGLATSLLLFYVGWKLTDQPWLGGLVGLAHTLNLGQLFFESNLLSETLTTFLVAATVAGVLRWFYDPQNHGTLLAALLGLTSTIALLVRPLFIFLPFYVLIFIIISDTLVTRQPETEDNIHQREMRQPKLAWRHAISLLVPVILLLGGWITFIHAKYGDWSLTTMTGYHLIQHTGNFFEYVPDEYASLRDTYIQFRNAHIAQYGTQTNAIWDAIPAMSQASGYNFYDLSRVLAKISLQLILKHPDLFLKSALQGWWMFWRTSVYWSASAMRYTGMAGMVSLLIQIQRAALFMANIIFILASLYFVILETLQAIRHKPLRVSFHFDNDAQHLFSWFLVGLIWITSILQTLLDHGDNPRFLVPLQSLVLLWLALFVVLQWKAKFSAFRVSHQR